MIITKCYKAEAAHRLKYSYTKRCHGLHGHSYRFEISLKSDVQDDAQMLMDFTLLTKKIGRFLDTFDHTLLIWEDDQELKELGPKLNPRYMIVPYNTTAEQISRHIYFYGKQIGLPMHEVVVWETQTAYARFAGDDAIRFDPNAVILSEAIQAEFNEGQ